MPIHVKVLQSVLLGLLLFLVGCSAKQPPKAPPTPLGLELAGRLQVNGVIKARRFREGLIVYAGRTLEIGVRRRGLDPP